MTARYLIAVTDEEVALLERWRDAYAAMARVADWLEAGS